MPPAHSSDPLKDVWAELVMNSAVAEPFSWWVDFGRHTLPGSKLEKDCWTFSVRADRSREELAAWFEHMAKAVRVPPAPVQKPAEAAPPEPAEAPPAAPKAKPWVPQTEAEFKRMVEDEKKLRLPRSDQDSRELTALVPQGPGAIYAWLLGPNSFYAERMTGVTWADLGVRVPLDGCQRIIEAFRKTHHFSSADLPKRE